MSSLSASQTLQQAASRSFLNIASTVLGHVHKSATQFSIPKAEGSGYHQGSTTMNFQLGRGQSDVSQCPNNGTDLDEIWVKRG